MKKLFAIILSVALVTGIFTIGSSALTEGEKITIEGKDWYVISPDLLEESGLGDPQVIHDAGLELEDFQWLGHEDWNPYEGWMGFRDGTDQGHGISDRVQGSCDLFIKIPMNTAAESLNAAVASSVIMWEYSECIK